MAMHSSKYLNYYKNLNEKKNSGIFNAIFLAVFFEFSFFSSFFYNVKILLNPPTHHVSKRKHLHTPPTYLFANVIIEWSLSITLVVILFTTSVGQMIWVRKSETWVRKSETWVRKSDN